MNILHRTSFCIILSVAAMLAGCSIRPLDQFSDLVDYRRTGGFVGVDDHLIVQSDGTAVLDRSGQGITFTISDALLHQLEAAFDEANFTALSRTYLPGHGGADNLKYIITYRAHVVQTADGAVPEVLWPIINLLNQIIDNPGGNYSAWR